MRIFKNTINLLEEVRRDIIKSPLMTSSRVQATESSTTAREAMNYSYGIDGKDMPQEPLKLARIAQEFYGEDHPIWGNIANVISWIAVESVHRFQPLAKTARYGPSSENFHDELRGHIEGNHYGYTYRERMIGMLPSMETVLSKDRYSRRAFWPIYEQRDSHRASDLTRIPCTLGYHFMVRDVPIKGPHLHIINYQRSCDFDKFFLSDLWFTHQAQKVLAERLDVKCGMINHNISSLHLFTEKEIY